MMRPHEQWLADRIVPWALAAPHVRAIAELGSRTHQEPADEWADMDLLVLVTDETAILDDDRWIEEIGPHWIAVRHPGPFPDVPVRQVLFEGALDFDVIPMRAGTLAERVQSPYIAELIGGGFVPIVDKDGELAALALPEPVDPPAAADIARSEFDFVVSDFLFQTVWAAKHLRRGELWAAKDDVDGYMKADLVRMFEWHTMVTRPGTPIRGGGRYLERWADARFIAAAPRVFAAYEASSVASALLEMIDVFALAAHETAVGLGFPYPSSRHELVADWVRTCLADL